MQVKRVEDNAAFTMIKVKPWPEDRFADEVLIVQEKNAGGKPVNRVQLHYATHRASSKTAREFAEAILRACDIADVLEREGAIVLEGEQG